MNLSFEQPDHNTSFSALFIHQDSYIDALRNASFCFGLHLLSSSRRELPLVKTAYMKISNKGTVKPGTSARVSVMELIYSKTLKLIVGIARLKRNFTCMPIPYIVLAGSADDNIVSGLISGKYDNLGGIVRHSVDLLMKGKIGNASVDLCQPVPVENPDNREIKTYDTDADTDTNTNVDTGLKYMYAPDERPDEEPVQIPSGLNKYFMQREQNVASTLKKHGITSDVNVTTTNKYIRPEVTETVERQPTTKKINITRSNNESTDNETWNGLKVLLGTRGGKYVITKNGRKKYIKGSGSNTSQKSNIVYKVRLSGSSHGKF